MVKFMSKNSETKVAVCSRSFSKNIKLREEILKKYSNVTFNDLGKSLRGEDLQNFLEGHDRAIVALEPIDDQLLTSLPELNIISKYGVGLNNLTKSALEKHNIKLGWQGGVNRRAVAELTLGFALSMMRNLVTHKENLKNETWKPITGRSLSSRVIGIVGCGFIGKDLVKLLKPFGCKILVNDIEDYPEFYEEYSVTPVSFEELLAQSDIVTLHVPLDKTTENMVSKKELSLMKEDACLINCARGGLIHEDDLYDVMKSGKLSGAAVDVFLEEPAIKNKLLSLDNFLASPHIGGSTEESIFAMGMAAINGLEKNQPANEYGDF